MIRHSTERLEELVFNRLMEKTKKPTQKEKKERLKKAGLSTDGSVFPGHKEMKSLSVGIAEEAKDKPDCRSGNKNFDELGRFSTKDNAAVWSGGYYPRGKDCKYGKWRYKGGKNKRMTSHRCGRAPDGTKEKFRCKDGVQVRKEDHQRKMFSQQDVEEVVLKVIEKLFHHVDMVEEQNDGRAKEIKKTCAKHGFLSFKDFLVRLNTIELARKGDLYKDAK